MDISFYDTTGKITGSAQLKDDLYDMMKGAPGTQPHVDGNHWGKPVYVLEGIVTDRPANPATISGHNLSTLPIPCKIRIRTQTYDCTKDTAELTFNFPGTYPVIVSAWPYLDKEFSVENPA